MKKIIFILGSGHCGSTLLDLMLDAHPAVAGVGEMHGLRSNSVCTCGEPATMCPFWSQVASEDLSEQQEVYRTKFAFLLDSAALRSIHTHKPIDAAAFRKRIMQMYERMNADIIVDSSKSVDRALLLSQSKDIEPIMIHLVRDGRAVTWSYVRKYKRLFPYFLKWAFENLKIEMGKRRFKGQKLFVRYEDLADDPARVLRSICEQISIAYDPVMLDFRSGEHHQIGGNRMRFESSNTIKPDNAWRREMPYLLRVGFNLIFGWLNLSYARK